MTPFSKSKILTLSFKLSTLCAPLVLGELPLTFTLLFGHKFVLWGDRFSQIEEQENTRQFTQCFKYN
jgi:hypothetical protein